MSPKNLTTIFVTIAVIASSFPGIFYPQKAEAILGVADTSLVDVALVTDPVTLALYADVGTALDATAVSTAGHLSQSLLEWAKSFAISILKRQILDVMVDQVVNWIQNGGEPRFVTDWEGFFSDIAQNAAGQFVEELGAGFLCDPFALQLKIGLLPVQKFGQQSPYACTFDKIVSNVENFYQSFQNGGWIAYDEAGNLQNNYYGALWLAWYGRENYVANKLAAANSKINANKGFLSVQVCRDAKTGLKLSQEEIDARASANGAYSPTSSQGGGSFYSPRGNVICEDTTPGGFVGATLEKTIGVDFDFIVNAQQLGDYAAAIVNALINRVIKEGVNGLRGVTGGTAQAGNTPTYNSAGNLPSNLRTSGNAYTRDAFSVGQGYYADQLLDVVATRQNARVDYNAVLSREKTLLADMQQLLSCGNLNDPIRATTQTKITDQNARLLSLQKAIDANEAGINSLLTLSQETVNLSTSQLTSAPTLVATINQAISQANQTRTESQTLLVSGRADFDARNVAVQTDLNNYCASTARAVPR